MAARGWRAHGLRHGGAGPQLPAYAEMEACGCRRSKAGPRPPACVVGVEGRTVAGTRQSRATAAYVRACVELRERGHRCATEQGRRHLCGAGGSDRSRGGVGRGRNGELGLATALQERDGAHGTQQRLGELECVLLPSTLLAPISLSLLFSLPAT